MSRPVETKIKVSLLDYLRYKYERQYEFGFCFFCGDIFPVTRGESPLITLKGYTVCVDCEERI
jgi:hypothetical protein